VAEASGILGVTVEAVRGRIKRDTLEHEKAEDGTVYVLLKPDQSRPAPDQSANQSTDQAMTMARLENEVQFLREELARKDAILLNMTEAMKALTPPREDAPESPEPRSGRSTPTDAGGEAQEPSERPDSEAPRQVPWWRRMFGG
jgi:hypothetical protein